MTKVTIKNIHGQYKPLDIFQFFDNGLRKRLPKGVAEAFKEYVIENIETNRFRFELTKDWQDYKRSIGANTQPYMMFDHYKKAITIVTENGHLAVGFKKTSIHPRAGISMGRLAMRLEYGDLARGLEPRPLWRRSADTFFSQRKKQIGDIITKSLKDG